MQEVSHVLSMLRSDVKVTTTQGFKHSPLPWLGVAVHSDCVWLPTSGFLMCSPYEWRFSHIHVHILFHNIYQWTFFFLQFVGYSSAWRKNPVDVRASKREDLRVVEVHRTSVPKQLALILGGVLQRHVLHRQDQGRDMCTRRYLHLCDQAYMRSYYWNTGEMFWQNMLAWVEVQQYT